MCNDSFHEHLAPLDDQHLAEIKAIHPRQANFAEEVFGILKKGLSPQVNLLVAFVILKKIYDSHLQGIFSAFGRVLYAPLSIVAKTGDHEWTRFRPAPVAELHDSFLSFMLAKPNRLALEGLLEERGLMLSQRHCCGILFGLRDDVQEFEDSEIAQIRNEMRSYAESMGMPVVVADFDEIPNLNSDLGPAEYEFYRLYMETFNQMSKRGRPAFIDCRQEDNWDKIVNSVPAGNQNSLLQTADAM